MQDRTHYELVKQLQDEGWSWRRLPKRASLDESIAYSVGQDKLWYSSGKGVEASYLACLLNAESLVGAGDRKIRHGQVKKYYVKLLKGFPDDAEALASAKPRLLMDVAEDVPVAMIEDLSLKHKPFNNKRNVCRFRFHKQQAN